MASLFNPRCGVKDENRVDDPQGGLIVRACAKLSGNITAAVCGVIVVVILLWATLPSDPAARIAPGWAAVPAVIGVASVTITPWLRNRGFQTLQDDYTSSGMAKSAWLQKRTAERAAETQAAATRAAGINIAGALLSSKNN